MAGAWDQDLRTGGISGFETIVVPALARVTKTIERIAKLKRIGKQVEQANLTELRKQIDDLERLQEELATGREALLAAVANFRIAPDAEAQAEWAARFKTAIRGDYPPVEGEFPEFRLFPVEVKVEFANELVRINGRIIRTLHPQAVAAAVMKELDRLYGERFNPAPFARAVLRAYDLLRAKAVVEAKGQAAGRSVALRDVHEILAGRHGRSAYSLSQFAFDIYRLRRNPADLVVNGRKILFGKGRRGGGIPITDPHGRSDVFGSLEVVEVDYDD